MKQYKHKTVNATAELCSDGYWYLIKYFDKDGDETTRFSIPKYLIENTNDWEEIKPEPKYKVGDWVKTNCNKVGKITGLNGTGMESIFVEGTGWIYESQIKCKVKPKKLWFNVYEDSEGYYIGRNYLYESEKENSEYLKTGNFLSTHSITIYEEVEE
jgi:hypothetical protein